MPATEAVALVAAKGGKLTVPRRRGKKAGGEPGAEGQEEEEEDDGGQLRALAAALKHISASPEYCRTLLDRVALLSVRIDTVCVSLPLVLASLSRLLSLSLASLHLLTSFPSSSRTPCV